MELPFSQENHEGFLIRTFSKDVESDELKWHYDLENRKITILEGDHIFLRSHEVRRHDEDVFHSCFGEIDPHGPGHLSA